MISNLRGYLKNAGLYFASSLVVAIIGLLLNPTMAKNLSPEDYAILGYYASFNLLSKVFIIRASYALSAS